MRPSTIRPAGLAAGRILLMLLAVVTIVSSMVSPGTVRSASAAVPLRQVDWLTVLQNDPAIVIDPDAAPLPNRTYPYVQIAAPWMPEGTVGGYALIEDVLYGNLDASGAEEAIVPVHSGGTAGTLGFLLYREADPAPRLVLVRTGYKLGISVESNKLVIHEPHYVGFEPNCCPSAIVRTLNALEDDRLVPLATEVEPNDVQEPTVWSYYLALGDRRYEEAYEFHSAAYQASNPFSQWRAGFANTQSIDVETAPGNTRSEVLIQLTATDARPDGGTITRRFKGTWTLIWSPEKKRWLLDKASIQPA